MARSFSFRTWDDYFIPGTHVLRNRFTSPGHPHGETEPAVLKLLEEGAAAVRLVELGTNPIEGRFDYDHFKAMHRHIFQDVYEWAGQERVAPTNGWMSKDGHRYYPAGPVLSSAALQEFRKLAAANYLRGLDHSTFVAGLAESWGELNTGGSALLGEELIGAHDE